MLYRVLITLASRIPCFQRGLNTSYKICTALCRNLDVSYTVGYARA